MIKADSSPILYIIISVVLMIISALGKSKKKVQQHSPSHNDQASPERHTPVPKPSWQQELEEIFGNVLEETTTKVPESPLHEEQRKPETVVSENSWTSESQGLESEISDAGSEINEAESLEVIMEETKIQQQHVIQIVQDEEENKGTELEGIDLEKAVIYSEIINRKYF